MSVLAVLEQRAGNWHRISLETLAAAQQIAREWGVPACAAVVGNDVTALAADLAAQELESVVAVEHELLAEYTADGYCSALRQLIESRRAGLVLFPHTYQVRDYLPKLAASMGRAAVCDAIAHRFQDGLPVFVRQLYQGKLHVDLRLTGRGPHFVSLQAGAYRADRVVNGSSAIERFIPRLDASEIRTRPGERMRAAQAEVDLTGAAIIVAVGRGIRDASNLSVARELADALGAELAASRPICDAGWLPMERQVGSSGQTVSPKLYIALGISGAIQHLVGMKGSQTIVAINKDPAAPIFEVADYGIVGDLFEAAPELARQIRKCR
jgi:electron transfer flavoprotein alpha subunit